MEKINRNSAGGSFVGGGFGVGSSWNVGQVLLPCGQSGDRGNEEASELEFTLKKAFNRLRAKNLILTLAVL
jgi:hypothetical protein